VAPGAGRWGRHRRLAGQLKEVGGEQIRPFGLDLSEKMVEYASQKIPDLQAAWTTRPTSTPISQTRPSTWSAPTSLPATSHRV